MQNCEKISVTAATKLNSSWNGTNDTNYGCLLYNIALPLKFRAGMQNCEKISETKLNSSWNGRNDKNYGLEAESFTKQRSCFLFDVYRKEE